MKKEAIAAVKREPEVVDETEQEIIKSMEKLKIKDEPIPKSKE